MTKFTHLHVHSEYSLLDGLSKIPVLLGRARELGMDSIALTDHGVMHGAIKFYTEARRLELKPIIGVEAYMAARSRFDKQAQVDSDQFHLTLLAKSLEGYKNLMRLTTMAHLQGFYYKPRIDMESLTDHKQGLIVLSGCLSGEVPSLLLEGKTASAEKKASQFQEIFGRDYFLEVQKHQSQDQEKANERLIKLSRKLGIPLVATNDAHYVFPEDAEAQDTLLTIQTQRKLADADRLTMIGSPDYYLRSGQEMAQLFTETPDAIENTQKIAQSCNLEIPIGRWILPNFPLPEGETAEEHLKTLVSENLPLRYPRPAKEILDRVDYELDIICKKGFATYFLIVQDFVNWAKSQGIRVGPGRGSAPGSIVSYILRITSIDPIEHKLPFERFMSPYRPTPPDIDLDFADDRRDEVIAYVTDKYGKDKVAQIITFGTMEARQAVRDVGRVMGMPYAEPDKIAKLIPFRMSIKRAVESIPELTAFYREEKYKKLLDLSQKLEGVARHASTHAAGVVIADQDLTEYTPLQRESQGEKIITEYDMYSLDLNISDEAIGLLKMDFLGLRNLTILQKAMEYIKRVRGEEIDISEVPLSDPAVYQMIGKGETTGLFQLESAGMRRLARQLRPEKFSDIAAMIALYRPGPMEWIDEFIKGKLNPGDVRYHHNDLKPILEETYGIAVYQEQCMEIAHKMASFTMAEADKLRLAIGKKSAAVMGRQKKKFIDGAMANGYSSKVAEKIFGLIERFAGYGFNKAHSTSYAMIAYQTGYMKAHFPVEFMAALMTAESANAEKVSLAVEEARRMGIKVMPPDISTSEVGFTLEDNPDSRGGKAVRFGLSAVKNVGRAAIEAILESRKVGGDFVSLSDFCQRVDGQKANKKVVESLIKVGAMDAFGKRSAMLASLDKIRQKSVQAQRRKTEGQASLFEEENPQGAGGSRDDLPEIEELPRREFLLLEKSLLGFYLTEHPLRPVLDALSRSTSHKIFELSVEEDIGARVKVGGLITQVRRVLTKKGNNEMAFVRIEDDTGSLELVVFPRIFAENRTLWQVDQVVAVSGRLEYREETFTLVVNDAQPLSEATVATPAGEERADLGVLEVRIPPGTTSKTLIELNSLLQENRGEHQAVLIFERAVGPPKRLPLPFAIKKTDELVDKLREILGGKQ